MLSPLKQGTIGVNQLKLVDSIELDARLKITKFAHLNSFGHKDV